MERYSYNFRLITSKPPAGTINLERLLTPNVYFTDNLGIKNYLCFYMDGNIIRTYIVDKYYKLSKVFKKYLLKIFFNNILLSIYNEVKYRPGNSGYIECKDNFEKVVKNDSNTNPE